MKDVPWDNNNNSNNNDNIKTKFDNMQQNSKCRICDDKDETINYIIRECSKLAQKDNNTSHVTYWTSTQPSI